MLYRFTIRVPTEYIKQVRTKFGESGQKALLANIKSRASNHLGLFDIKTIIQDPTNNELFSLVSRVNPQAQKPYIDPVITVAKIERVEEPPTLTQSINQSLEPGLTPDEAFVVRHALLTENNPRHLSGFASTFEPYFPITASLLRTKSFLLECRVLANRKKLWEANSQLARNLERKFGQGVLKPCSNNLATDLGNYTRLYCPAWQDISQNWGNFCQVLPQSHWYKSSDAIRPRDSIETLYRQLELWSVKSKIPMEVLRLGIKRAICLFIDEPSLMFSAPVTDYDRDRLAKLPPQVINIAKSLLVENGIGVWTIDLDKYSRIFY